MNQMKNLLQKKSIIYLTIFVVSNNIYSNALLDSINTHKTKFENVALEIWNYAELGYQEEKSSSLLAQSLEDEGFVVKRGLAEIPSAFTAEYNNGGPII